MIYRPAERLSEIVRAWEIVHDAYVRIGLIPPMATGVYLHGQALAGRGCVAVALDDGRMVATAGAIIDGPAGLPLDGMFPGEIDGLRGSQRLAECGVIASDTPTNLRTMMGVCGVLLSWGKSVGATGVFTSCHPHHAAFYARGYGLRQVGPERHYEGLSDGRAPVVMLFATFEEMETLHRERRGVRHWLEHPADLSRMMEPSRLRDVA